MLEGQLIAFLIAISLLTVAPGADTVVITRNSIRGGFKDGFLTSTGTCLGLYVHALISAGGVSLILLTSAYLFTVVKLMGAAYLVWLGVQSLMGALKRSGKMTEITAAEGKVDLWRSLREGFLSNVLNPKTGVFYMAFLPQFMDPAKDPFLQAMILTSVHFVVAMVWQGVVAAMVDKAKVFLTSPKVSRWFDGLVGTVLVAFGLKLALSDK